MDFQCRISNRLEQIYHYVASIACLQTLTPSTDFIAFTGDRIWPGTCMRVGVFDAKPCNYNLVQFNGTQLDLISGGQYQEHFQRLVTHAGIAYVQ